MTEQNWKIMEFVSPIREVVKAGANKEFIIKGIAISEETTRNGITYIAEELEKAAPSWTGKPILLDHSNSVKDIVGRVKETVWNNENKSIEFAGQIMEEDIQNKINQGLITDVSIGAMVEDMIEDKEAGTMTAIGLEGLELSLVAIPGSTSAGIENAMQNSFRLKESLAKEERLKEAKKKAKVEVKTPQEKVVEQTEEEDDVVKQPVLFPSKSTTTTIDYSKMPRGRFKKLERDDW